MPDAPSPKERPILFSAEMVRAILNGRKTMTRRVVKPQPPSDVTDVIALNGTFLSAYPNRTAIRSHQWTGRSPYGQPGDRLWVRETWQQFFDDEMPAERPRGPLGTMGCPATPERKSRAFYRADGELNHEELGGALWRPSIHMPRWASRILLEVTAVRVERVQDISEEDARAEGVDWAAPHAYGERRDWDDDREDPREVGYPNGGSFALDNFRRLWDHLNAARGYGWDVNPWVWAMGFRRLA